MTVRGRPDVMRWRILVQFLAVRVRLGCRRRRSPRRASGVCTL